MKTLQIILFSIIVFSGPAIIQKANAQPGISAEISFNTFYDELSPYGRWMNVPRYGQVWSYNEPGFRPYSTNGQWEYSELGWSWASNYEWGWAPFHYGRWELDDYYGWIWIPGYDYAPAWVTWSESDDYYGWAPLGFGLDINISIGRIPSNRWMYASRRYITYPQISRYCVPYERNHYYAGRQRPVINIYTNRNVRFMGGPQRRDVERITHSRIQPRRVEYGRPGNFAGSRNYNNRNDRGNGPSTPQRNYDNRPRNESPRGGIAQNDRSSRVYRQNELAEQQIRNRSQFPRENNGNDRVIPQRNEPQRRQPQVEQPRRQEAQRPQQSVPQRREPERRERLLQTDRQPQPQRNGSSPTMRQQNPGQRSPEFNRTERSSGQGSRPSRERGGR